MTGITGQLFNSLVANFNHYPLWNGESGGRPEKDRKIKHLFILFIKRICQL